jgi:ribosome-binding protein aMBF1 (putative translation factor)
VLQRKVESQRFDRSEPACRLDAADALGDREIPADREWSQKTLAERANINATYVSGIERGRRNVSIDILYRLAIAFDVKNRDLV